MFRIGVVQAYKACNSPVFVFWGGLGGAKVELVIKCKHWEKPFSLPMLGYKMHLNLPRVDFLSPLFFLDALRSQAALISPYNLLYSNFGN